MAELLLTTVNGQVIRIDTEDPEPEVVFQGPADEALMGLCMDGEFLFVASLSRLYKFRRSDYTILKKTRRFRPSPDFHQMNIYNGLLYATATKRNQIWIYDRDLRRTGKVKIAPPDPRRRVRYKQNYNHINTIVKHRGEFYINLNWLTDEQYGDSGVLKTDADFRETGKFKYAWESHDFQFAGDQMLAICSTSGKDKKIMHPPQSGLMADGKLVWTHDPDESFCKGLCFDRQHFFICGGKKAVRSKRKDTAGIIYVLDRNSFEWVNTIEHEKIRGLRGARVI
jgi:hypothetical protein